MEDFTIPNNGSILLISRNHEIIEQIKTVLEKGNNVEYHDTIFIINYDSIDSIRNIFIEISSILTISDKRNLLCSFMSSDFMDTLKNITSFYQIYQKLINNEIVQLIKTGHLYSIMQPIYDIQNKKLFGYEFLLRGKINDNIISPLDIYETANEIGLHHLLDSRAREINILKASKLINKDVKIFVNFLPSSLDNPEFSLQNTFEVATINKVPLANIVFEVVETENIKDFSNLKKIFVYYRQNGTMIAMDDVGAGYSSLNNLHKLAPDYVKIDRDLISYCDQLPNKLKIIETIVNLCQGLDILILAEGIERVEELRAVQNAGINLGQGYLLGRPSEDEVLDPYKFE